ncbi:MAG: DNA repair protein RecO C-terminal domain-containing protein [Paramuribaculum sp.]|nr:DNA repair protein RecO C-terminal domain-containing protein [Paramuribaculum sp.]
MKHPVSLIVLRSVRCNERTDILSAYSRELGPLSFVIPAGSGKEATRRRALLQPMSTVEGIADISPTRELARLSQIRPLNPRHAVIANPVKNAVALMMADLLCAMLRQGQPDGNMWDYISMSLDVLDSLPGNRVANFHIVFIYGLGVLAGIEPDVSTFRAGCCFDIREGRFLSALPLHGDVLTDAEAKFVVTLSRMTYNNMHRVGLSRDRRNSILDHLLRYITIHYVPVDRLRSIEVVRELFV